LEIDFMIWFWGWLNVDNTVDLNSMEAALTNQIYHWILGRLGQVWQCLWV
jgi:hypothetical protein